MPDWFPHWATTAIVFALAVVVAVIFHRIVWRGLRRLSRDRGMLWRSLVEKLERPTILAFVLLACVAVADVAPLSRDGIKLTRQFLTVGLIGLIGWGALAALHIWTAFRLNRLSATGADEFFARKRLTQSRILERVIRILIVFVTISSALMTFDEVRQFGVSLFASAGIAGIVLGVALQPMLKNLIAGVQLAFTQPIRINDAVIVENEWGNVEEITSSYVVIKLWDLRRLIVPLSYFLEKPFQNWTREGRSLIGIVMLYADFSLPVDELRTELNHILRDSSLWDGQVAAVQVTELEKEAMQIRILVSASDAGKTFDLRCEVREKIVAFVCARYPEALPKWRVLQPGGQRTAA